MRTHEEIAAMATKLSRTVTIAQPEFEAAETLVHASPCEAALRVLVGFLPWEHAEPLVKVLDPAITPEEVAELGYDKHDDPEKSLPWEADPLDASIIPRLEDVLAFGWKRVEHEEWLRVRQAGTRTMAYLFVLGHVDEVAVDLNPLAAMVMMKLAHTTYDWPIPDHARKHLG